MQNIAHVRELVVGLRRFRHILVAQSVIEREIAAHFPLILGVIGKYRLADTPIRVAADQRGEEQRRPAPQKTGIAAKDVSSIRSVVRDDVELYSSPLKTELHIV